MRSIFLTVSLLAALASAQGQATFEWRGTLQPEQTLEIRNIQGNIQAVPATGSEVEISVQITGTRPDPRSIHIHVEVSDGGVLACTIYEGISHPNYCTPEITPSLSLQNSDIKVQYFLKVPEAVKLVAKTVNGRVTAELPLSRIKAETVNGRITVATQMPVEANLVNGSIDATLAGTGWSGTRRFQAVNGSIDVEVQADCNASVDASLVWGAVTTEFPLQILRFIVGTTIKGDINQGGPLLAMETVNGSIHLRKTHQE